MSDTMPIFVCTKDETHELAGLVPKFCSECGAPTSSRRCWNCDLILNATQKFCERCGKPAEKPEPAPEGVRGEQMTPTELFAEIADRITAVVKQPYREEPITQGEWDTIRDSIITMKVVEEKANGNASS